ncbi:MAG: hypothetical protein IT350_08555 [Deltaproteobacteria bacterium]|nr:hypothetical protein [Deltaproteobacteria bacterium]
MSDEILAKRKKGRRFFDWYTGIMSFVGWAFFLELIVSWELPWGFFVGWFVAFAVFLIGFWRFRDV